MDPSKFISRISNSYKTKSIRNPDFVRLPSSPLPSPFLNLSQIPSLYYPWGAACKIEKP